MKGRTKATKEYVIDGNKEQTQTPNLVYNDILKEPSTETKFQVSRLESSTISIPTTQPIMQNRIIRLKNHHTIKPTLREEVATMVVYKVSTFFHLVLKFITYLYTIKDIQFMQIYRKTT